MTTGTSTGEPTSVAEAEGRAEQLEQGRRRGARRSGSPSTVMGPCSASARPIDWRLVRPSVRSRATSTDRASPAGRAPRRRRGPRRRRSRGAAARMRPRTAWVTGDVADRGRGLGLARRGHAGRHRRHRGAQVLGCRRRRVDDRPDRARAEPPAPGPGTTRAGASTQERSRGRPANASRTSATRYWSVVALDAERERLPHLHAAGRLGERGRDDGRDRARCRAS